MKKLYDTLRKTASALILIGMVGGATAQQGTINDTELDFLVNFLNVSLDDTRKTLSQVDEEMWKHQPASGWSVGECMEHIMLAEAALFKQIQGSLQQQGDNTKSLAYQDGFVITRTVDRGKKVDTPLKPQAVRMSKSEYLLELEESRAAVITFLSQPDLELRNHFGKSPFGEVDTYQLALILAGHGMRHTAQMREIMAEAKGVVASY